MPREIKSLQESISPGQTPSPFQSQLTSYTSNRFIIYRLFESNLPEGGFEPFIISRYPIEIQHNSFHVNNLRDSLKFAKGR